MSMEKASFLFPPGVRFHPSDEELIVYYLINKLNSRPLPAAVVGEIELYNHNPWDLPKKALFGEDEWYFFSPRERKYPNGARPNRSAASGYWKATGTDKVITSTSGARIGVKKALVFYVGKPPNGMKTDWIMIEYRIPDTLIRPQKSKGSMRLDHWVLCRIKQKGKMLKNMWENDNTPPNQNRPTDQNTRPTGDIPNMNDFPPVSSNPLSEVCSNYFQPNDCPILAKLGAYNEDMPQVTSSATTISQRSSNIGRLYNATTYEHDSSMDSSRMTDSSYNNFDGSYNQMSTPSYNDNGYEDFTQFNRGMPVLNRNESDVAVGLPPPSNNDTSIYDRHQSRDNFDLNLLGAMANLHSDMFDGHFMQPVNSLSASEFYFL